VRCSSGKQSGVDRWLKCSSGKQSGVDRWLKCSSGKRSGVGPVAEVARLGRGDSGG
jgi:hypothetical protein